jgi:hypothetical protein
MGSMSDDPVDIVDRIDELVNWQLAQGERAVADFQAAWDDLWNRRFALMRVRERVWDKDWNLLFDSDQGKHE